MIESLKVLCVCQYGHSRSVAACRAFHARGVPAVACGAGTAGSALGVVAEWADRICLLDDALIGAVPPAQRHKIVSLHVGPDRWVNPYNPELREVIETLIDERMPFAPKRGNTA